MNSAHVPKSLVPRILFEDTHLIVLSKPAGLLSQGEITGDINLVDWARAHVGRNYVGLVHRLDRNTSGAMVIAKRTKAAERLTRQLQEGQLKRTYLAWIHGRLEREERWEHSLFKDEARNITSVVPAGRKGAKAAVLRVRPIRWTSWEGRPVTLSEFELETGRSHQIRAQSAYEKHPLVGDRKYGAPADSFLRPALHSSVIEFEHPMTKETLRFEAPLPEDMLLIGSN